MIWILLLYVLPFLICCVVGYFMSKTSGETVGQYLQGVLFFLIPLFNILFILFVIWKYIKADKSIQEFFNRKL
jgi:hypothetical protein